MTLTSTTTKIQYNGDGSTVSFPITFIYWLNADIKVIHKDAAGTETTWTLGTQYTLTGGEGSTGTLTVEVSPTDYTPASGETLTIKSIVPSTQTTALPLGGALPSVAIEERLDKNVRLTQQREEELDRSIKLSETSTASEVILTDPVTGEFLRWKADGSLESAPLSASGTATGVDETDTNTTKDKLTSNALAKRAEDTAQAVNGVQVASAVNQLQVTNSATGNPVLIEPTGTDTNISVNLTPKGTGTFTLPILDVDNININGNTISSTDTNGPINLTPNGTGDLVLDGVNWPQADGTANQVPKTNGSAQISWSDNIIRGTAQATTSGTSFDFTGIAAGTNKISVIFNEVSLSGTDNIIIQIGDSGGIETGSYISSSGTIAGGIVSSTSGLIVVMANATVTCSGIVTLKRVDGNSWISEHSGKTAATLAICGGGSKTLSAELTQLKILATGANTFDAGSVNIFSEI